MFLLKHDCEVFGLKTSVEPCTVYYQKACRLLWNVCIYEILRYAVCMSSC